MIVRTEHISLYVILALLSIMVLFSPRRVSGGNCLLNAFQRGRVPKENVNHRTAPPRVLRRRQENSQQHTSQQNRPNGCPPAAASVPQFRSSNSPESRQPRRTVLVRVRRNRNVSTQTAHRNYDPYYERGGKDTSKPFLEEPSPQPLPSIKEDESE